MSILDMQRDGSNCSRGLLPKSQSIPTIPDNDNIPCEGKPLQPLGPLKESFNLLPVLTVMLFGYLKDCQSHPEGRRNSHFVSTQLYGLSAISPFAYVSSVSGTVYYELIAWQSCMLLSDMVVRTGHLLSLHE